jgi:CheY-like chemotaxis protein
MKADSKSHHPEATAATSERPSLRQDPLNEALRPRLEAILKNAELLKTKAGSDENVQAILTAARGLLDVINRESAEPRSVSGTARLKSSEQCDVLYIEDDSRLFASVNLLLTSKRALKVLQAATGKAGISLAQTHDPKLILLDLDLPDMHGSEVIQHLQKDSITGRIPVVVISGDATPSQIERLLILGARNYLTKPFEIQPFFTVIDEVLEEHALGAVVHFEKPYKTEEPLARSDDR